MKLQSIAVAVFSIILSWALTALGEEPPFTIATVVPAGTIAESLREFHARIEFSKRLGDRVVVEVPTRIPGYPAYEMWVRSELDWGRQKNLEEISGMKVTAVGAGALNVVCRAFGPDGKEVVGRSPRIRLHKHGLFGYDHLPSALRSPPKALKPNPPAFLKFIECHEYE